METREKYLDVPRLIKGGVAVDDRGVVTFCNNFDMSTIKRFYMLENHQEGFVRAWHGHIKEAKWIMCVSGVAVVGVAKIIFEYNESPDLDSPDSFILCSDGDVLYVPPGYANGHKNLIRGTRLIHFSNLTLGESEDDDVRFDAGNHGWVWEVKER